MYSLTVLFCISIMPTRQRTQFTDDQTQVLEETFRNCYYPNSETKRVLAQQLGLIENRITVSSYRLPRIQIDNC